MNPMQEVEVLRAACCVAGIDGEVTENELVMINQLAAKAGPPSPTFPIRHQ